MDPFDGPMLLWQPVYLDPWMVPRGPCFSGGGGKIALAASRLSYVGRPSRPRRIRISLGSILTPAGRT